MPTLLIWCVCRPLKWMESLVVCRTQNMIVNRSKSSMVKLSCGVPQRSVLGPLLFVLYTKDISTIIRRHGLWNHCYADDTQVYFNCKPEDVNSLKNFRLVLMTCVDGCSPIVLNWMLTRPNASKWQQGSNSQHLQHPTWQLEDQSSYLPKEHVNLAYFLTAN